MEFVALISRRDFESKPHWRQLKPGDVWPGIGLAAKPDAFGSKKLARLWIVTVRPDHAVWLLGVLHRPRFQVHGSNGMWVAAANEASIVDITSATQRLFSEDGAAVAPAKLSIWLRSPRALTAAAAHQLEAHCTSRSNQKGSAETKPVLAPPVQTKAVQTKPTPIPTRAIRHYLVAAMPSPTPIKHGWDDANPHLTYTPSERSSGKKPAVRQWIAGLQPQLSIALAVAHAEWIAWRMKEHAPIDFVFELIEAAWVTTADPSALRPGTFVRREKVHEWKGPVRGAIWELVRDLSAISSVRHRHRDELVHMICCLADHVVPARRPFRAWQRTIFDRFDRLNQSKINYPIAPCAADPTVSFEAEDARRLFRDYLATIPLTGNRFLKLPPQLERLRTNR